MNFSKLSLWNRPAGAELRLLQHEVENPTVSRVRSLEIVAFPAIIGSGSAADIRITSPYVSAIHCRIDVRKGRFVIHDLESSDGTYVNECPIIVQFLDKGDVIEIGQSRFTVLDART
jgi:pSer/pThr/pTyr-binding forkhead associated (FHA) protein